jgi:hypothetical protein
MFLHQDEENRNGVVTSDGLSPGGIVVICRRLVTAPVPLSVLSMRIRPDIKHGRRRDRLQLPGLRLLFAVHDQIYSSATSFSCHTCVTFKQMSQERSSTKTDLPLDYLPLVSPEATVLRLFSDEVSGFRMAGSRAASGSGMACGRGDSSACCQYRSGCRQECHRCPHL